MPSGPQHYVTAEQLLASAAKDEAGSHIERYRLAAAQVHATLALAAATALNDNDPNGKGMPQEEYRVWMSVASSE